jgi:hypothetical protein
MVTMGWILLQHIISFGSKNHSIPGSVWPATTRNSTISHRECSNRHSGCLVRWPRGVPKCGSHKTNSSPRVCPQTLWCSSQGSRIQGGRLGQLANSQSCAQATYKALPTICRPLSGPWTFESCGVPPRLAFHGAHSWCLSRRPAQALQRNTIVRHTGSTTPPQECVLGSSKRRGS